LLRYGQVVDILFVKGVKSKDERQAILASSIGAQSSQKKGRMSMDDLEIYPADGCPSCAIRGIGMEKSAMVGVGIEAKRNTFSSLGSESADSLARRYRLRGRGH